MAALVLSASVVAGQDVQAQAADVVISSASRYGQSVYEAPASVTVISREEIRRFGYRTLGDVLSAVGGAFTSYDRNYTYLTVRGLAQRGDFNTRVLVLIDGRRLNRPTDHSSLLGTEGLIDLDAVERVEVMRGPGSTLYGTNAFYAVVNLVTRTGASAKGIEAHVAGGNFESGYASLAAGTRTAGGLDVFATASAYTSRGPDLSYPEFDAPETNGGHAVGLNGDRFGRTLVRVMKGDFSVEGFYSSDRKEIPTASWDTAFGDPRAMTREGGGMLSASYEHAFEDLSRVWTTASYQSGSYEGHYPYADEALISDYIRSRWLSVEGQYQKFVAGRHRVSVGGEVRRNLRLEHGVLGVYEERRSSWVLAGFLQGELGLGERVTLHAGGRYDHYATFGGTFNPRLALVAEPWDGTYLKGMYGRAFRAPSTYELSFEDGGVSQKPAGDLAPERLQTFEVALERRVRPRLRASVSVYHTRARNLIGLVTDPADDLLVYTNGETARSTGVELGVDGNVTARVFARATYAFQRAEENENLRPVGSPRHVAHLAASASMLDGQLVPGLEVYYLSARATLAGAQAGSHALADLTVQLRPKATPRLELLAKVGNLLDKTYGDPGGEEHRQDILMRDGRTAWFSVRFRF